MDAQSIITLLAFLGTFLIVALAAESISGLVQKYGVPLISGFLLVGIISGPHVLNIIKPTMVNNLVFINDIALAFIAFAASSELYLKELRSRISSIKWLTIGQLALTFLILSIALILLSDYIPFLTNLSPSAKIAVAFLTAAVLCARSPSSVIAVINEVRAKGPFTSSVLGTTVVVDFSVIIIFAVCFSAAKALVYGDDFTIFFLLILVGEIALSLLLGLFIGLILKGILSLSIKEKWKAIMVLLVGYSTYGIYYGTLSLSLYVFNNDIHLEPLLMCLIGSLYVVNYTRYRQEFLKIIHEIGPYVYIVFFTYAGALLAIDVIPSVWEITIIIVVINAIAIFIGTFIGGAIAKEKSRYNFKYWTSFLTQAGVGLGLATIVSNEFNSWGAAFSAVVISVIVINQLIGPVLFKWSINKLDESRTRAGAPEFDGIRDAIIIGFESQSVALARQLMGHGWQVKIATRKNIEESSVPDINIVKVKEYDLQALNALEAKKSEAFVLLLTDEENLEICELIYQHIGTKEIVVRLNEREYFEEFHQLGALVVDPGTAMVSLLDHFVRSPQATSLLLGLQKGQDTIDLEVLNPNLFGMYLRDLRLPADVIILSVHRKGQMIISHGYTRLRAKDMVTMVGSQESLRQMTRLFDRS
ncbi:MAG: monovalent cation:proton antiporter family protein [Candidatus Cyclobacteriaceae bacterium M2_1C_046]